MRIVCFGMLLAFVSFGCSSKPIVCTSLGSLTQLDGQTVPVGSTCSYDVSKHSGAACPADDITIGLTVYTGTPSSNQTYKVGLVYTVSSLADPGKFTTDPSQLCSSRGYYTSTGNWSVRGSTESTRIWVAPGEPDALPLPALQEINFSNVVVGNTRSSGTIQLMLSAD